MSQRRNFSEKRGVLHDGQSISSTEVETHLERERLVYGGGDSSTEEKTCLWRGDSSTEEETHLRRRRLVYGGEDSSMEGESLLWRGRLISFDGGTKLLKVVC
jgi:hypothetical protein